jgi:hypothetical protein
MIYLALIVPHVLAIFGLLAYAYRSGAGEDPDEAFGGSDGFFEPSAPPPPPTPSPAMAPLPLPDASPPRRRIRVGGRLSESYPQRPRRTHAPAQPSRPRPIGTS